MSKSSASGSAKAKRSQMLSSVLPPVFALGLMVTILFGAKLETTIPQEQVDVYMTDVASVIDAVPSQIGDWIGTDTTPPAPALEMLQPNRILQRRYTNLDTGEWFEFLIVHCGEVNDMGAHYPPVCYPAHGWAAKGSVETTLPVGSETIEAREYRFARPSGLRDEAITITSTFALPGESGGQFGPDRENMLERAGRFRERSRLGAGQIQIITPTSMTGERREEIVGMCATMLETVFKRIGEGVR